MAEQARATMGEEAETLDMDIVRGGQDLPRKAARHRYLKDLEDGQRGALLASPPYSTWNRATGSNRGGPPSLRNRKLPWGFPWLRIMSRVKAQVANRPTRWALDAAAA